jgi:hypothetical protein
MIVQSTNVFGIHALDVTVPIPYKKRFVGKSHKVWVVL